MEFFDDINNDSINNTVIDNIDELNNESENYIDNTDSFLEDNVEKNIENTSETLDPPQEEILALTVQKDNSIIAAKNIVKKSFKLSIKSLLVSISLTFLNLFI